MSKRKLRGIVPPMVTPFREDNTIDKDVLRAETRTLIETPECTVWP